MSIYIALILMEIYLLSVASSLNVLFKVNENVPKNHRLGSLLDHLSPAVLKYQNEIKFIIMNTEKSQFFNVDELTGEVRIAKDIDRENLCHSNKICKLEFTVNCLHLQSIAEIIEVAVNITDINDNKCVFIPNSKQTLSWREDSKIEETTEFINRPKDADVFYSILKMSIQINSEDEKFGLNIIPTGSNEVPFNLELILKSELDYETKKLHYILISASDGMAEHSCFLNITIIVLDINDNSPKFPQDFYSVSIPENYSFNKSIIQLHATDKDSGIHGQVYYVIDTYVDQNVIDNFELNRNTGSLFLIKELNYFHCKSYLITIEARNVEMRSRFGTTKVLINVTDINNEAPEIKLFSSITGTNKLTIEENQGREKDVAMVTVTDKDFGINAKVNCNLQNQTLDGLIELREIQNTLLQNTFRLVIVRGIDREVNDHLSAILVCNDLGQPSLTTKEKINVTVLDQNDNTPIFHSTANHLNIVEDSDISRVSINFRIIRFHATDKDYGNNSLLKYYLVSVDPNVKEVLKIDPISGVLFSNGNIDKEKIDSLSFKVIVSDAGEPPKRAELDFQLNIDDYNDHAPRFSEMSRYNFEFSENRPKGELVGVMYAKDLDIGENGRLNFFIESSVDSIPFKLDYKKNPLFGRKDQFSEFHYKIEIISITILDRESIFAMNQIYPKFDFIVRSEDNGNPKLTHRISVQIDILDENDLDPVFDFATKNITLISLSYYESENYKFGKIGAYDQDEGINGTVQFLIRQGNPEMKFYLDPRNGDLRVAKKLTFHDIKDHKLTIVAKDMGSPPRSSTMTITVKVDDSPPLGHQVYPDSTNIDALNLYIIIAIVVASFIISVVLLIAICVVLQKSRIRTLSQPHKFESIGRMQQENYLGLGDLSIANYYTNPTNLSRAASINLLPIMQDNVMDSENYMLSNGNQSKFDTLPNDYYRVVNPNYQQFNAEEFPNNNDKDSGKGDSVDARILYQHLDSGKLYGVFDNTNLVSGPMTTTRMINNASSSPYEHGTFRRPLISFCKNDKSNLEHKIGSQTSTSNDVLCNINNGSFV